MLIVRWDDGPMLKPTHASMRIGDRIPRTHMNVGYVSLIPTCRRQTQVTSKNKLARQISCVGKLLKTLTQWIVVDLRPPWIDMYTRTFTHLCIHTPVNTDTYKPITYMCIWEKDNVNIFWLNHATVMQTSKEILISKKWKPTCGW